MVAGVKLCTRTVIIDAVPVIIISLIAIEIGGKILIDHRIDEFPLLTKGTGTIQYNVLIVEAEITKNTSVLPATEICLVTGKGSSLGTEQDSSQMTGTDFNIEDVGSL